MKNGTVKPRIKFEPANYRGIRMSGRLDEVIDEIKYLKGKISELFENRGGTDREILELAVKIDCLLNEHDSLLNKN